MGNKHGRECFGPAGTSSSRGRGIPGGGTSAAADDDDDADAMRPPLRHEGMMLGADASISKTTTTTTGEEKEKMTRRLLTRELMASLTANVTALRDASSSASPPTLLFSTGVHGTGLSRFESCVAGYDAAPLLLMALIRPEVPKSDAECDDEERRRRRRRRRARGVRGGESDEKDGDDDENDAGDVQAAGEEADEDVGDMGSDAHYALVGAVITGGMMSSSSSDAAFGEVRGDVH